jgi:bifunctional non-homologous end joining protein LigD
MEQSRYAPMQAARTDKLPVSEEWAYEPGLSGLRIIAHNSLIQSRLFTSGGRNYSDFFPEIAKQLPVAVEASQAILDGQIVALNKRGREDKSLLYRPMAATIIYYAFDMLELDDQPLIAEPWIVRRQLLENIINEQPNIKLAKTFDHTELELIQRAAKRKGVKGIIAKRIDSPYMPNRQSMDGWLRYTFPPPQRRERRRVTNTAR